MTIPAELDEQQRAVLDLPVGASAAIVGAPGTGKTRTLVELAARRVAVDGFAADELVVVSSSRQAAAALRDRLGIRIGEVSTGPLARTATSIAFEVVGARAAAENASAPALLSGGDHDLVIRELLEGHLASGTGPAWPDPLDATVRRLGVFRTELRELMMRATEYAVTPQRMRQLADSAGHAEWAAVADFIDEYRDVIASARDDRLDPAELAAFAEVAVRDGFLGERLARLRLILVDDLQQVTEGTVRLLAAFAARGVAVVGFGDPDIASNSFRGGEADVVGRFGARIGVPEAQRLPLDTVHRHGQAIRDVVSAITARIGTAGEGTQRAARGAGASDQVRAIVAPSAAPLHRGLARQLRERHLLDGVPWADMAVVVRSSAGIPSIARSLAAAQVPTRTLMGGRALRDEVAAAALLELVAAAVGREELTADRATRLLRGPYGRLDAVGLRRLRLALRAEELAGDGTRPADELLVEALEGPDRLATIDHSVARDARRTATVLAAVRAAHDAGSSAEEVLWAAWDGSHVADEWKRQALGAGIAADEANTALDGIVALFTAARRFVERRPGDASIEAFLSEVLDAEVPDDTLAPQPDGDAVLISTPAGTTGFEFDTVAVVGLQDGQWPNLRPRGSLLGGPQFLAAITGKLDADIDQRREVLADELRIFALAVSRARARLVLAAVDSDDETPSPLFGLATADAVAVPGDAPPLTLRGLTARFRRVLTTVGASVRETAGAERAIAVYTEADREAAASALAAFAAAEVPGADPSHWRGLAEPSTEAPLWDLTDPETRVPVSPSRLEEVERSPMEWFVGQVGGGSSGLSANVGTLIHDVMENAESPEVEALWAALQARWSELDFESAWHAEVQSRIARRQIEAVSAYLANFAHDGKLLVSAEGKFELDIVPAKLTGKIDRVESHAGAIVIVDLKTGSVKSPQEAIDHPQLGAYQVAYADGAIGDLPDGHRPGGAALLFTKKGSGRGAAKVPYTWRPQEAFDAEQLAAFRTRVREAAQHMIGPILDAAVIDDPYAYGKDERRVHLPGEVSSD